MTEIVVAFNILRSPGFPNNGLLFPQLRRSRLHSNRVGNGISFRKIPRNRLGTISVIPRKKVLIPKHSEFRGRANSEARNGTEFREKMKFNRTVYILKKISFNQGGGNQFLQSHKNFQSEYCRRLSLPRFVLRCFLFCGMVRKGIPS